MDNDLLKKLNENISKLIELQEKNNELLKINNELKEKEIKKEEKECVHFTKIYKKGIPAFCEKCEIILCETFDCREPAAKGSKHCCYHRYM